MSQICNPCAEGQVCLENLDRYSLQDDTYYFVINCLPGFFCDGNNVMYLVCCEGTTLQETFPEGITVAERNRIINRLIARCMIAEGFCDDGSGGGGGSGGTKNGGNDGTDPDNPVQFYSNRPQSSTVRCPDGLPFTYTVPPGLFIARTQEAADAAALNHARTLAATLKVCLSSPLRLCCNGNLYASTIVASGGRGAFRWYVSGSLPTGLVSTPIGNNGLRISGIPTANGNFTFTVRAVDSFGNYMEKPITITVWGITDTALPQAFVNIAYVYQIPVTNGTAPYTFSIVSGAFPNGLTMGPDGIILGTPTEGGDFTVSIRVVDSASRTCTKELTMESGGCASPVSVTFTIPATPSKEYSCPDTNLGSFAVIEGEQKISKTSSNTALGCLDIVNFVGVPFLENQFLMNAEVGWQSAGQIYEPSSGLIVSIVAKAATLDRVAFFDATAGYVDSVELATTTTLPSRTWMSCLMRGQPGKVAFFRLSVTAGLPAYIYIIDAVSRTVENLFSLTPPLGVGYGRGDFCYSCQNNEFYFGGQTIPNYLICKASAVDGTVTTYDRSVVYRLTYADSIDRIVTLLGGSRLELTNPADGTSELIKDLDDGSFFPFVSTTAAPVYNFKLDSIMLQAQWDELPIAPFNDSTGVLIIRPSDLAITHSCKGFAAFQSFGVTSFDEDTGDIYSQFDEAALNKPFHQIRPTIT